MSSDISLLFGAEPVCVVVQPIQKLARTQTMFFMQALIHIVVGCRCPHMKSKIAFYRNQDNDETADGDFNADAAAVDDRRRRRRSRRDDGNNVVDQSYLAFV